MAEIGRRQDLYLKKKIPFSFHTFTLCLTLPCHKLLHSLLRYGNPEGTGERPDRAQR